MSSREIELAELVRKITRSESLVKRAEIYRNKNFLHWTIGFDDYFREMLARRKDQIEYEKHRAEKLGWLIAGGRDAMKMDI